MTIDSMMEAGAAAWSVETLGECKITSPVSHHEFIREGARVLISEDEPTVLRLQEKLGALPTFERAGPLPKIFHDPSWTRVGIVTAGGLCPGLNNVIKTRDDERLSGGRSAETDVGDMVGGDCLD